MTRPPGRPRTNVGQCITPGCDREQRTRHLCKSCYGYWRYHGVPPLAPTLKYAVCQVRGCGEKHYAKGWCYRHYFQWRNHGEIIRVFNVRHVRRLLEDLPDIEFTAAEVADRLSLHPITVRQELVRLYREGKVDRQREQTGWRASPYLYRWKQ